jgi:hypothetical protein
VIDSSVVSPWANQFHDTNSRGDSDRQMDGAKRKERILVHLVKFVCD